MCTTELECLQLLYDNSTDIKAFCYALAIGLGLLVVLYVVQKVLVYTVGQTF